MKQRHPDLIAWAVLLLAGVVIVSLTKSNLGLSLILIASILFVWSYLQRRRERREVVELQERRTSQAG